MEQSYKEKYEQALAKAKEQYNYPCMRSCMGILEEIFPELAESEDEKMMKEIIELVMQPIWKTEKEFYRRNELCAWLKKQVEHANFLSKIQVDDKVTRNEAGVLVNLSQLNRVAKNEGKQGGQKFEMKSAAESLGVDSETYNKIVDECIFGEQKPANKIEPKDYSSIDPHFGKPADKVKPKFKVGDKIRRKTPSSFDKDMQVARIEKDYYVCNHIGKFSSEVVPFSKQSSYELIEQKPAWSDEEEAVLDALIRRLKGEDIHVSPHLAVECLKSLKGRVQPKQEWGEEDEHRIKDTVYFLDTAKKHYASTEELDACIAWLESLKGRVRPQWKPSDNELEVLRLVAEKDGTCLMGLYEQLKKLKED